jgi:hypothetical protein
MLVLDNFYPQDVINPVILESKKQKWEFTRSDSNEDVYWTNKIFGWNYAIAEKNQFKLDTFTSETVKKCWEFFKIKTDCGLNDSNLDSVYYNGLTYGIEAHAHIDALQDDFVTVITYVCEDWNSHWGGETVFFSDEYSKNPADPVYYQHEITRSVLPKYNRVVIFPGNVVHAVRPLSRSFKDLRKTLMFKIKGKRVEDFEKLCS